MTRGFRKRINICGALLPFLLAIGVHENRGRAFCCTPICTPICTPTAHQSGSLWRPSPSVMGRAGAAGGRLRPHRRWGVQTKGPSGPAAVCAGQKGAKPTCGLDAGFSDGVYSAPRGHARKPMTSGQAMGVVGSLHRRVVTVVARLRAYPLSRNDVQCPQVWCNAASAVATTPPGGGSAGRVAGLLDRAAAVAIIKASPRAAK
jgi:hypothetical protein